MIFVVWVGPTSSRSNSKRFQRDSFNNFVNYRLDLFETRLEMKLMCNVINRFDVSLTFKTHFNDEIY